MGSNASISVNKETVRGYLESGKVNPFLIPEYQRPYAWSEDEVTQLFDDLREFTESEIEKEKAGDQHKDGTFFLGTIVAYLNEDTGEREVIDGQQRITSLLLLLRAIYTKLQKTKPKTPEAKNFMAQIEPCIWRKDKNNRRLKSLRDAHHVASECPSPYSMGTRTSNDVNHKRLAATVYNVVLFQEALNIMPADVFRGLIPRYSAT